MLYKCSYGNHFSGIEIFGTGVVMYSGNVRHAYIGCIEVYFSRYPQCGKRPSYIFNSYINITIKDMSLTEN